MKFIDSQIWNQIYTQLIDNKRVIDNQVRWQVRTQLWDSLGRQIPTQLKDQIKRG